MPKWKIAGLLAIGMIGLPFGAHLLIEGARGIEAQTKSSQQSKERQAMIYAAPKKKDTSEGKAKGYQRQKESKLAAN